ncbi:unnamed protein product [Schistocephalus solidus]|uniref:START domain-containing protein n=1 Tax=Schistocephalus solidus TaxID=70667 RepID=A0A183SG35_SCHSO|nr:unnamed protein product [Schistocephalus solidus]
MSSPWDGNRVATSALRQLNGRWALLSQPLLGAALYSPPLIGEALHSLLDAGTVDQYDLYRQDRICKRGGGCLLYIEASFKYFPFDLDDTSFSDCNANIVHVGGTEVPSRTEGSYALVEQCRGVNPTRTVDDNFTLPCWWSEKSTMRVSWSLLWQFYNDIHDLYGPFLVRP